MSQELSGQSVDNPLKMFNNDASFSDDSASASAASSPTSRVKFLCSHGGKILLRPPDGHLKYVGGETRVIAVPRDLRFSDLMKKLKAEFESDVVLKYQVVPDDLDILVSVRTDEDLKHMLEEYDRHESQGITKFRAFLFPSNPTILEAQTTSSDPHAPEQRYLEAVNGTYRSGAGAYSSRHNAGRPTFSISACNSPNCGSPESNRSDTMSPEHRSMMMNNPLSTGKQSMSRVRSSPSLCSLNSYQQQNSSSSNFSNHNIHRPYPHYYQQQPQQLHLPHSYQQQQQQQQQHKPPSHDPHRLSPGLPFSRHEMGRIPSPVPHHGLNPQYYSSRHNNNNVAMGAAGSKYGYQDEHTTYSPVYRNFDRMESLRSSSRMGVDRVDMS
ncbi:hypothetical protein LINGRAHAP2_LOCUS13748 [Linum grandiflorum]